MNCAAEQKQWVIYDEQQEYFLELTNEELKTLVEVKTIRWEDKEMYSPRHKGMIWIDGIIKR
jgi:hypothetical protein